MYKIFASILASILVFGIMNPVFSASLERDLNVKFSSAGDDTYTTNLLNVSRNNTDITFQFVEVSGGGAEEYSINLPTGFTYQSANIIGNTCANFTTINAVNTNYHFSFNGAPNCIAKTEFTYRVTTATTLGSTPLYLLEKTGVNSWSIARDPNVEITSTNSITSAIAQDLDADGYIDAYLLSFTTLAGVNAGTLSTLTVAGVTPGVATASGSNWILPFTDGVLPTGTLPQIGGVFDTVTIGNMTILESLQTMNCTASNRVINTHSYSIPLFNNTTTTSVVSSAVAIANGTVTYTQVFACTTGTVTVSGSETMGTPICNNGYTLNNGSCVAIPPSGGSGGGGGGGGITTATAGVSTSSPQISTLSLKTLDTRYFTGFTAAHTYLSSKLTLPSAIKLAETYKNKLTIPDSVYFLSIDKGLTGEYNRITNAYVLLLLRTQDVLKGNKTDAIKNDVQQTTVIVGSGATMIVNLHDRYITRTFLPGRNITIYRTKNPIITKALAALEAKVLAKFDRLLSSGTISRAEYDTAVQAYNDFILHLSLYRDYGRTKLSKDRALAAIKVFTGVYARKIIDTSDIALGSELIQKQQIYQESAKKLVGDVYAFTKDLRIGDKNQDVTNLQTILKSYGYFGTLSPTGYFGTLTANYLAKFSQDILGINNPNGLFNSTIRNAIVKIELK